MIRLINNFLTRRSRIQRRLRFYEDSPTHERAG